MIPRMIAVGLLGAVFAVASAPARVDGDLIRFGSNIHVAPDAEVEDAVCFFCNVLVEGKVTGDVVVLFGNIRIAGDVQHDAVDIFGSINAENNSSIEQDVISVVGAVRLGEDRIVNAGWIVWGPLLFVALVALLVMRSYRAYRRRLVLRGYDFSRKQ
jgi:hypothetical protein